MFARCTNIFFDGHNNCSLGTISWIVDPEDPYLILVRKVVAVIVLGLTCNFKTIMKIWLHCQPRTYIIITNTTVLVRAVSTVSTDLQYSEVEHHNFRFLTFDAYICTEKIWIR